MRPKSDYILDLNLNSSCERQRLNKKRYAVKLAAACVVSYLNVIYKSEREFLKIFRIGDGPGNNSVIS